jgi:hypothetical protein
MGTPGTQIGEGTGGNGELGGGSGGAAGHSGGFGGAVVLMPVTGGGASSGGYPGCAPTQTVPVIFSADTVHSEAGVSDAGSSCSVTVPPFPPQSDFRPDLVNVTFKTQAGLQVTIANVASDAACPDSTPSLVAWFYEDATEPVRIGFCAAACDALRVAGGAVTIVVGCGLPVPFR